MILPNGFLTSRTSYIPRDLLSDIFAYCVEDDLRGYVEPSARSAPLTLSWVCKYWREIVFQNHRLWTGLSLSNFPSRMDHNVDLVTHWLAHSGSLPFAIRLLFDFSPTGAKPEENVAFEKLVDVLLKDPSRLSSVEMLVPDMSFTTLLPNALRERCQNVQHLGIAVQHWNPFPSDTPVELDLSLNKSLKTVRIFTPLIRPPKQHASNLYQLTRLELRLCPSLATCLAWLDLCPNLESLTVEFLSEEDATSPLPVGPVRRLDLLYELKIKCLTTSSERADPGYLLDLLELPSLLNIELDMNSFYHRQPWPHVIDLLMRSHADISALSLTGTPMSGEEIVQCLQYSPSLFSLQLENAMDVVLESLTPRSRSLSREEDSVNEMDDDDKDDNDKIGNDKDDKDENARDDKDEDKEDDDASKYDFRCRDLAIVDFGNIDECSLQAIYNFVGTRCEIDFEVLAPYVDLEGALLAPPSCWTLQSILVPYDALFHTLSHPIIIDDYMNKVYF